MALEDGTPLALYPEQRVMLTDYFGGVRETLILIPKKNGKTTLLAALGLFHLAITDDAACYIGAASRDQASILFDQAAGYVRRSPYLQEHFRVQGGYRQVVSKRDAGKLRVLAADANTADGVIPTLALVDELHRHRSSDLYAVFRDGLGPRDGQMVTISTAGDDESSPLGRLRTDAHSRPGLLRTGAHWHVRTPEFALHEWALDPDDDREDIALVKTANPAPWQTEAELLKRLRSPSTRPWEWARFAAGLWVAGEESAISEAEWRACARPGAQISRGTPGVVVGIDLGWKHDCTAFVAAWRPGGTEKVRVHPPVILTPPGDGNSLAFRDVWAVVERLADRWPEVTFVLDPAAGGEQLAQKIDSDLPNARVATHSQMPGPMCRASQRLADAIAAGRLEHPDHPELNRHVMSAAAKQIGEMWRFVKQRNRRTPIDGVIALAMALSTVVSPEKSNELEETEMREQPGREPVTHRGDMALVGERYVDRDGPDLGPQRGR